MKNTTTLLPSLLGGATLLLASLQPAAADTASPDALLKQMSSRLSAASTFSFTATREIDPSLLEGRALAPKAKVTLSVQRPDKLAGTAVSREGTRTFIADGRTLSLLDSKNNHYSTVPMRTSIDGLVARLDATYGFVPPLAEFAVSNPYTDLRRQVKTLRYLGTGKTGGGFLGLGGTLCHRIALDGPAASAELWISAADQLPRKLVATFHQAGNPQVRITFHQWNLGAAVPASTFTFTAPAGAEKIDFFTTAQMAAQAARP